ncbi:MAG: flagellar assembly protein FliW, partial [Actinomycetota bacterium]|nr:flagellar assembly protein FliW [Actinomycetota bacterium]
FSDYTVRIDEDTATELEITNPKDALILNIVTLPAPGQNSTPTVNLLGPIIVNRQTRAARQIVLHDSDYSVAAPMVRAR